jgi:hypothetical protein
MFTLAIKNQVRVTNDFEYIEFYFKGQNSDTFLGT